MRHPITEKLEQLQKRHPISEQIRTKREKALDVNTSLIMFDKTFDNYKLLTLDY